MGKWRILTAAGKFVAVRPECEVESFATGPWGSIRVVIHTRDCVEVGGCCYADSLEDVLAHVDRAVMEDHFHAPVLEAPC